MIFLKKITTTGSSANFPKACPFEFGLDPVVVIFFKKYQKNYKRWIKCISKNGSDQNFFRHFLKKITTAGSSANFLSAKPNGQGFNLD